MAFPHQQSREDHEREEDITGGKCVQWNLVKRTVDISVYRDRNDDVNPAKNRTYGEICSHGQVSFSIRELIEPCDNSFQATDELLPAPLSALVGGLLIGTEAGLLYAQMSTRIGRRQRKCDDAPKA